MRGSTRFSWGDVWGTKTWWFSKLLPLAWHVFIVGHGESWRSQKTEHGVIMRYSFLSSVCLVCAGTAEEALLFDWPLIGMWPESTVFLVPSHEWVYIAMSNHHCLLVIIWIIINHDRSLSTILITIHDEPLLSTIMNHYYQPLWTIISNMNHDHNY